MTKPNRDLWQAGAALQDYIAANVTSALEHIQRELSVCDGYPGGNDEPNVTATAELTSVERAADARWQLTNAREDLRDHKAHVLAAIRELNEFVNTVQRMRVPRTSSKPEKPTVCRDGQKGLDGQIEWGDPLCNMSPVKKGMCLPCYQRYYRWCEKHGVDRLKDFEPA